MPTHNAATAFTVMLDNGKKWHCSKLRLWDPLEDDDFMVYDEGKNRSGTDVVSEQVPTRRSH